VIFDFVIFDFMISYAPFAAYVFQITALVSISEKASKIG